MSDDEEKKAAEEKAQAEAKKLEEKKSEEKDWDKVRQEADQFKANLDKTTSERDALAEELDEKATTLQEKEVKLAELKGRLETQAKKDDFDFESLDPNTAEFADVVKQFPKIGKLLKQVVEKQENYDKLVTQYEADKEEAETKTRRDTAVEKILGALDKRFGAKYRNEARKQADELVNSGKSKQPQDALDAYFLLEPIYEELKKKAEEKPEKKKTTPTDTGAGGISFEEPDKSKQGTLSEVLADMKKNPSSWKKE